MTVAEAARALGISESAVRKRVKRGRLEHERTPNGRLIVYLNSAATSETDRDQILDESHDTRTERYIRGLEDRVEHLQNELDQDREANRENRAIIAALEERIAELEASQTATVEPESRERHPLKIDPKDAVLVQFFITAGASIAAVAVLVISVLNGQVLLAGLASGLTLLSIASFLSHRWLFRSGTDRVQETLRALVRSPRKPARRAPQGSPSRQEEAPLPLDFLLQLLVIFALIFGFVRPFVMEAF